MRLSIVRINSDDPALGRDRLVESLDVSLNRSDLAQGDKVLRIGRKELIELVESAIGHRKVFRSLEVGNDLI